MSCYNAFLKVTLKMQSEWLKSLYVPSQCFWTHSLKKGSKLALRYICCSFWYGFSNLYLRIEVSKHVLNVPFFNEFQKSPICEHYIDGLIKSMAVLSMSSAPVTPKIKCRLIDIEDFDEDEEQIETTEKKKKTKKSKLKL